MDNGGAKAERGYPGPTRCLKISNVADNADITQLQACETRHRRMQKVSSMCMDSGPLRANTVLCHFTQLLLLSLLQASHKENSHTTSLSNNTCNLSVMQRKWTAVKINTKRPFQIWVFPSRRICKSD